MKKLILSLILVCVMVTSVHAQKFYTGGSVGVWYQSSWNAVAVTVLPEIGYHINEKWAIGGTLDVALVCPVNYHSSFSYSVLLSPYGRFTYLSFDNLSLFVDGGFTLGINDQQFAGSIGFKPGLSVKLSDQFGLMAHLGFLGYHYAAGQSALGFKASSENLSIGAYWLF